MQSDLSDGMETSPLDLSSGSTSSAGGSDMKST